MSFVLGSHRPTLFEACAASQTDPSGAGMAEWIPAGSGLGAENSSTTPVSGSSRPIWFPDPISGIQNFPSLPGAALNGMRSGPSMSYSTYTILSAASLNGRTVALYAGISDGDFGRVESTPNASFKYEITTCAS